MRKKLKAIAALTVSALLLTMYAPFSYAAEITQNTNTKPLAQPTVAPTASGTTENVRATEPQNHGGTGDTSTDASSKSQNTDEQQAEQAQVQASLAQPQGGATTMVVQSNGNFQYEDNPTGLTLIKYIGTADVVTVPSSYNGKNVTAIGDYAFSATPFSGAAIPAITSVTLPASVTSIGKGAFYNCTELNYVNIPDGVTSIGSEAFAYTAISAVTVPDGVTALSDNTFYGCPALTYVTLPQTLTSIGNSAFAGCTSLINVTIPAAVTQMGERSFYLCKSLISLKLSDSLSSIPKNAFAYCTSLAFVNIPNNVTAIDDYAFAMCSTLSSVNFSSNLKSIGNGAFAGCVSLNGITLPESLTSMGVGAFYGDTALTSITIPGGVNTIPGSAFAGCTALNSVVISEGVTLINYGKFILLTDSPILYDPYAIVVEHLEPTPITGARGDEGLYGAFKGCSSLTSVMLPDTLKDLGASTFSGCVALTTINIPKNLETLDVYAFQDCKALTSLIFPATLRWFGNDAFAGCSSLTSAEFLGDAPSFFTPINTPLHYDFNYYLGAGLPSDYTTICQPGATGFDKNSRLGFGAIVVPGATPTPITEWAGYPIRIASGSIVIPKDDISKYIKQDVALKTNGTANINGKQYTVLTGLTGGTRSKPVTVKTQLEAMFNVPSSQIDIVDANDKTIATNDTIGTGTIVRVKNTDGTIAAEGVIAIKGDLIGIGNANISSYALLKAAHLKLINLSELQTKAADMSGREELSLLDVAMLKAAILELI